jgi:hypothetical protein
MAVYRNMTTHYDITDKIGPLWINPEPPQWPMYSFNRAAYTLWNAIASELDKLGWTEEQIKTWLQSKGARWALDMDLGDALEALGRKYAHTLEPWED